MRDLSSPTVVRWEIRFRASLIAAFRFSYKSMVQDLAEHAREQPGG